MSNAGEGSSSHAVYQQEIHEEELEPIQPKMSNEEGNSSHASFEEGSSSHAVNYQGDRVTEDILNRVHNANYNVRLPPIYEVPASLRQVNPSSFKPKVVSIGPLYKGHRHLRSEESKKPLMLKQLLRVVGSMEETLENCVKKVRGSIERIRRAYFQMKPYSDDELVEMMVFDGCYILLFSYNLIRYPFAVYVLGNRNIALDLVLLENQIPYFVLKDLYALTLQTLQPSPSLTHLLSVLLELVSPFSERLRVDHLDPEIVHPHHILDLLHKFYKPTTFHGHIMESVPTTHSAVELDKVGVMFRPNKHPDWPMAVGFENSKYWHKPTLRMPAVCVDNFFEVVLRNLIAYEQYSPGEKFVASYAMSMHILAGTPENISRLVKSGVIFSHFGSNENASDMIRSICNNVTLQDFHYMEWCKEIDKYYDSYWARNFKVFKRTYIDTPWKAIALLAAILVFLVTMVQFFRR